MRIAVVLLLWVYLSALILILGAQVSHQYELLYRPGATRDESQDDEAAEEYGGLVI